MTDQSIQTPKSPWKGLASYEEEDQHIFLGRERFINNLYTGTINNLFLTLYGKTGCGKTSLLQAGLFPLLRHENFLPIIIRLRMCPTDMSFGRYIISRIDTVCRRNTDEQGNSNPISIAQRKNRPSGNEPADDAHNLLWHYFYSHDFIKTQGQEEQFVFPVIVIDQMEEGFNERHDDACKLLKQLYYLVGDDLLLPDDCYSNFRLIMSMREDYLYMIEDAIEDGGFQLLKQNRCRLSPMHEDDAREVVGIGKKFLEKGKEYELTGKIINAARDETGHISTNMLSLICSQLFNQGNGQITEVRVDGLNTTALMENYYLECMSHMKAETRKFIEKEMVNLEDGRRLLVRKNRFYKKVDSDDVKRLLDGEYKIVQDASAGSTQCFELIHDSLAEAIKKVNDQNEELVKMKEQNDSLIATNRQIMWQRKVLGSLGVTALIGCIGFAVLLGGLLWFNMQSTPSGKSYDVAIEFCEDTLFSIDEHWDADIRLQDASTGDDVVLLNAEKDTLRWPVHIVKGAIRNIAFCLNDCDTLFKMPLRLIVEPNTPLCKADTISLSIADSLKSATAAIALHYTIKKNVKKILTFDGRVVSPDSVPVKGAFVILGELMRKTKEDGTFSFSLTDSAALTGGDRLIVIKREYGYTLKRIDSLLMVKDSKRQKEVTVKLAYDMSTDTVFRHEFMNIVNTYNKKTSFVDSAFIEKYSNILSGNFVRMYGMTPDQMFKLIILRKGNNILGYIEDKSELSKGLARYKILTGTATREETDDTGKHPLWHINAHGYDHVFGSWDITGTLDSDHKFINYRQK